MSWIRTLETGKHQAVYRDTEGRQRSGTFHTKRDAKAWLEQQQSALLTGTWVDPVGPRTTVQEWAKQWQAARPLDGAHAAKVRSAMSAQIIPYWGDRRLGEIRTLHVRGWVADMRGRLAPESVMTYYAIFRAMMGEAARERIIPVSPCVLTKGDMPPRDVDKRVFLNVEQVGVLVALAKPRHASLIHTAAWTGMRWGELAGLEWKNVDLDRGVIHVVRSAKEVNAQVTFGPPKSESSRRSVTIDPGTVAILRAHRDSTHTSPDLVWVRLRGGPLHRNQFRMLVWRKIVASAFLEPEPTFHDLRHTHASLMIAAGLDIFTLSKRLGHSKASMTLDRYGHLRHDAQDAVMEAIRIASQRPAS